MLTTCGITITVADIFVPTSEFFEMANVLGDMLSGYLKMGLCLQSSANCVRVTQYNMLHTNK